MLKVYSQYPSGRSLENDPRPPSKKPLPDKSPRAKIEQLDHPYIRGEVEGDSGSWLVRDEAMLRNGESRRVSQKNERFDETVTFSCQFRARLHARQPSA
jgi:hypothetical protein